MSVTSRGALSALAAFALLAGLGSGIASAQVVVARGAMPAPIVEVIPAAPGAGYAWVPGHHVWRGGGWFWVKGHYVRGVVPAMPAEIVEVIPLRPSPAHYWIKGHYAWDEGRWAWHRGAWVR